MRSKLYSDIAEELNIEEELVKFIDDHFFLCIRDYMNNPTRWKFLINNFATLELRYNAIKKFVEKHENRENTTRITRERIDLYRRLLQMGDEHKKIQKQHGKKRNYKRQTQETEKYE